MNLASVGATLRAHPEYGFGAAGAGIGLVVFISKRKAGGAKSSGPTSTTIQPAATADTTGSDLATALGQQVQALQGAIDNGFAQIATMQAAQQPPTTPAQSAGLVPPMPVIPSGAFDPVVGIAADPFGVPTGPAMPSVSALPLQPPAVALPVPSTPEPSGPASSAPGTPVSHAVVVGPPAPGTVFTPVGWVYPSDPSTPVLSPQQNWLS